MVILFVHFKEEIPLFKDKNMCDNLIDGSRLLFCLLGQNREANFLTGQQLISAT